MSEKMFENVSKMSEKMYQKCLKKCIKNVCKNVSKMLQICLFFSLEIAYFLPKHNLLYSRVVCYVRKSQQVVNP